MALRDAVTTTFAWCELGAILSRRHFPCYADGLTIVSTISYVGWLAISGCLLAVLSLLSGYVRRLPISSSLVYLAFGFLLGPHGLGWIELRLASGSLWFERLTECAVVTALFISGLKLRLPPTHQAWAAAYRLAGPVMVLCIAGVAAMLHWALGLSPPTSLLLGAVLAPTDPVLAGAVSVSDAAERDRVKYGLSGEAGLNDGTAFPFVVLALAWRQGSLSDAGAIVRWVALDVVWAVGASLVAGYMLGLIIGRLSIEQRSRQRDTEAPNDLAAVALIALSYTAGHLLHAWSFLAVFAAGVGLRRAELSIVVETPHPEMARRQVSHPPAEHLIGPKVRPEDIEAPAVAAGVLVAETMSFGTTVERVLEVVLVTLIGAAVGSYWEWRAVPVAFCLFFVLRPVSTYVMLLGTGTSALQRCIIGWFGIRGIGSLYYLAYAQNSLHPGAVAEPLGGLTLSIISLSILIHSTSATPLLALYESTRRHVRPKKNR